MYLLTLTMTAQFIIAIPLVRKVSVVIVPHRPTYLLGRFFQEIGIFSAYVLYLIPTISVFFPEMSIVI
jgi:hypothetical protein